MLYSTDSTEPQKAFCNCYKNADARGYYNGLIIVDTDEDNYQN